MRPGGAIGSSMSTEPLPVRSIAIGVPSMACERLNASCSEARIAAAAGPNASVAFRPPGTASARLGLPTNGGIDCVTKPAAAFAGGTANERSSMLPISSVMRPNADCTAASSAGAAPSSAASLSASCSGAAPACASPVSISSILPIANALG